MGANSCGLSWSWEGGAGGCSGSSSESEQSRAVGCSASLHRAGRPELLYSSIPGCEKCGTCCSAYLYSFSLKGISQ